MSSTTVVDHDRKRKSVNKTIQPPGIIIPFYPRLAAQIGFNDSLLLIQIDFWIHNLRVKVEEFEGIKWLNLSAQEMIERGFEHLSRQKINKTIERLVERDLLRVSYLPGSRTKWLALNYEKIEALGVKITVPKVACSEVPNETLQAENGTKGSVTPNPINVSIENVGTEGSTTPLYIKDPEDHLNPEKGGDRAAAAPQQKTGSSQKQKAPNEGKINWDELRAQHEADDKKLEAMMDALAAACQMDLNLSWHEKQIKTYAGALLRAGYTPSDVDNHGDWWREHDWRGKKGDIPRLRELADTLQQSSPRIAMRMQFTPNEKVSAELHRRADPNCAVCDGFGWITDFDPRDPGWDQCACIEHISHQLQNQRVLST